MIIPLHDTTADRIADRLVSIRREGGGVALSRVLTLLVPVGAAGAEEAIAAANRASMEHPCRVIVLVEEDPDAAAVLDAEIRVGGDAGASEVVVLHLPGALPDQADGLVMPLLLPDVPVVTWWPDRLPEHPAGTPLGALAVHRVTDSAHAAGALDDRLARLRGGYSPGDTDLAWTRLTWWRAHLAAILDEPPDEAVRGVLVDGCAEDPSVRLLAAWLGWKLRCPVEVVTRCGAGDLRRVELARAGGVTAIDRPEGSEEATLRLPGAAHRRVHLARRPLADCLAEELRRLDEDVVYGAVIGAGLDWLARGDHLTLTDGTGR